MIIAFSSIGHIGQSDGVIKSSYPCCFVINFPVNIDDGSNTIIYLILGNNNITQLKLGSNNIMQRSDNIIMQLIAGRNCIMQLVDGSNSVIIQLTEGSDWIRIMAGIWMAVCLADSWPPIIHP